MNSKINTKYVIQELDEILEFLITRKNIFFNIYNSPFKYLADVSKEVAKDIVKQHSIKNIVNFNIK